MSRVVVTGAAGNIGRAVTLRLLADGRPELRAAEQREMDRVRDARERALGASGLRRRARRFSVVLAIALIGAAARRYSGAFAGLPRVRYWIAWNEPNLSSFLTPQRNNVSANIYRALLNAFASAVKAVHQDNQVVAGQLDPVASHAAGYRAIAP